MAGRGLDTQDKKYVRTLLAASDALNHGVGRAERQRFGRWLTLRGRKESKLRLFIVTNFRLYVLKTSALRGRTVEKNLKIFDMSHLKLEELDTGGSAELSARFSREKPVNLSVICDPRVAEDFLHALMDVSTELMGGMPTRYHPKISVPPRFLHEYKPPVLSNQRALLWGYATACNYFEIRQLEHVFERLSESMQDTQRSVLDMGPLLKTMKDGKVVMIDSKQIKAIASAIQYTPLIQRIRIQDIELGDNLLKELNKVFRHNQALKRIILDNIKISKSGVADFAHDLTAKREFLESLVVRNNKIGDQGVRELCQALQRCLVDQLTIAYCNFSSKGYRSLTELLCTDDYKSTLIHLDISGNKAGSGGSKYLASWLVAAEKLETLELSDTDLDLDMVFQALSGNEELAQRRLQSVNFTGNKVPPTAAAELGSILQKTHSISLVYLRRMKFVKNAVEELFPRVFANRTGILFEIDLSECDLTEKGAQMFQRSMKRQDTIDCVKTLIMSNNNLGIQGTRTIAQCLLHMGSLENLKIDANIQGGAFSGDPTTACEAVAALLEHNALPKLVYLSMCGDSSSNSYVKDSIVPLLESLALNSTLTRLDISQNRMGDKGWEALVRAIGKNGNRTLQTIYCDDNKLSQRSLMLLARGIRFNNVIRTILPVDDIRRITALSRKKAHELQPVLQKLNDHLGYNKQLAAQEYQKRQRQLLRQQQKRRYADDAPEYTEPGEDEAGEPDHDDYDDERQQRGGRRRDRGHERQGSSSRHSQSSRRRARDGRSTQSRASNKRASNRRRRRRADPEKASNPPTIQEGVAVAGEKPPRGRDRDEDPAPAVVDALPERRRSRSGGVSGEAPWMIRMDPNRRGSMKALDASDGLPKQNSRPDFGIPIKDFEDDQKLPIPQYTEEIPMVLVRIFAYVFKNGGLEVPKIFQKAGYEKEIRNCKYALNKGRFKTANDLHSMAYLIRLWLQELPLRLLSSLKSNDMLEAVKSEDQAAPVLAELDEPNLSVFLWLLDMMAVTSRRAVVNEMTPLRLAKVFAPHLFSRKIKPEVAVSYLKLAIDFRRSKMSSQSVVFPSHARKEDFGRPESPREKMPTAIREKYLKNNGGSAGGGSGGGGRHSRPASIDHSMSASAAGRSASPGAQALNTDEKKAEERSRAPSESPRDDDDEDGSDDDQPAVHRMHSADSAASPPGGARRRRSSEAVPQRAHSQQAKRPSLPASSQSGKRKASDASSRSGSIHHSRSPSTPSRTRGGGRKVPSASGTSDTSLNPVFEARAQLLGDADELMTDRFEEAQYAAAAAPGQRRQQHPSAASDYPLDSRSRHASNASASGVGVKGRHASASVPMENKEEVLEEDHYGVRRRTSAKSAAAGGVHTHAVRGPYNDADGLGGLDEGDREEEDDDHEDDDDEEILLTPPANFKHALPAGMERTNSGRSAGSGADTPIAYIDEDVSDDDDDLYADDEKLGPGDHPDGGVLGDEDVDGMNGGGSAMSSFDGPVHMMNDPRMRKTPVRLDDPLEDDRPGTTHAAVARRLLARGGGGPGGGGYGGGGPEGGGGRGSVHAGAASRAFDTDDDDDDEDEEEELIPPGYAAERFSALNAAHNRDAPADLLTGVGAGGGSGVQPFHIPKPSSRSPSPPRHRGSAERGRATSEARSRGASRSGAADAPADPNAPPPDIASPAPRVLDAPPLAPAPLGSSRMLLVDNDQESDEYYSPRRKSGESGAGAALVPSLKGGDGNQSDGESDDDRDYEMDYGDGGESISSVSDIPSRAGSSLAGEGPIDYGMGPGSSRGSTPMLPTSSPPRTGSRSSSAYSAGGIASTPPLSMRAQRRPAASPPSTYRAQSYSTSNAPAAASMSQTQRVFNSPSASSRAAEATMTTTMRTKMNRTISLSIFTPPSPIMSGDTGNPMTSPPLSSPINAQVSPSNRVRRSSSKKRSTSTSASAAKRFVPTKPRAPKPANLKKKRSFIGQINDPVESIESPRGRTGFDSEEVSSSPEPQYESGGENEDDQKGGEADGEEFDEGGEGEEGEGGEQDRPVSPLLEPHSSPGSPSRTLPEVPRSPYDSDREPRLRFPKMMVLAGARSPTNGGGNEDVGDALSSLTDDEDTHR